MGRDTLKKITASLVLSVPPVVMLLSGQLEGIVSPPEIIRSIDDGYFPYLLASLAVFLVSVAMVIASPWYFVGGAKGETSKEGRKPISHFLRHFLGRILLGEGLRSLYGIFLFVLLAVITTAWLPDAISEGDVLKTVGTIAYLLSVVFVTAWVYRPKTEKKLTVETLVYGLSGPWGWKAIGQFDCDDLRRNRRKESPDGRKLSLNIIPLYLSLWLHAVREGTLKRVFLLYTDMHSENDGSRFKPEVREWLGTFLQKASECMGATFNVHWPGEGVETIGRGSRTIEVKFIYAGSGNDVLEVKKGLGDHEELQRLIEEESEKVLFHITGGTAVMSAAMMFEAIKGDARAEYTIQNTYDREPEEILKVWDITPDMMPDVWDAFERVFERLGL
ncbi:hypothetical protein A3L11_08520 [Thermococcus siculi]|uniref:Uncharacterized protein n=1 Tax=Thermococcus siculi TaxID=72803 RepID=A0A2Z2MLM4_9EURY|nr:hypothetical protein [Thermococcus siculi]ASJ09269.1 hypothetical protein A3L11_08520 [Thermococcus siculi]